MNEPLEFGNHLDADQLVAFAEGSFTERERQEAFAHLAVCEACRNAVFLVQGPQVAVEAASIEPAVPFWRRWSPLVYAGALVGCVAAAVSVGMWTHRGRVPAPKVEMARVGPEHAGPVTSRTPVNDAGNKEAVSNRERRVGDAGSVKKKEAPRPVVPAVESHAQESRGEAMQEAAGALGAGKTLRAQGKSSVDSDAGVVVSGAATALSMEDRAARSPSLNGSVQDQSVGKGSLRKALPQATAPLAAAPSVAAARARGAMQPPLANGAFAVRIEHGQTALGTQAKVEGTVVDASGAVIPGATVVLQQTGKVVQQTKTDAVGRFTVAELPAGKYDVKVSAPGFVTVTRELELAASDLVLLTSQVQVGGVSQTISVEASAVDLQTMSASAATIAGLPKGKTIRSMARQGKLMLALDTDGVVYLSANGGKRWKKVKPAWVGKASEVEAAEEGDGFEVTAAAGVVWASRDGRHWQRK